MSQELLRNGHKQLYLFFINITIALFPTDFQSKPSTSSDRGSKDNEASEITIGMETLCECCKKSFDPSKILKHIGNRKACKSFYGPRYSEMKRKKDNERKQNYRYNMTREKNEMINKLQREKYAKNFERKEKNKLIWKNEKEVKQRKKAENISLARKGLNCNGKEKEPEDEKWGKYQVQCEFCRDRYEIDSSKN